MSQPEPRAGDSLFLTVPVPTSSSGIVSAGVKNAPTICPPIIIQDNFLSTSRYQFQTSSPDSNPTLMAPVKTFLVKQLTATIHTDAATLLPHLLSGLPQIFLSYNTTLPTHGSLPTQTTRGATQVRKSEQENSTDEDDEAEARPLFTPVCSMSVHTFVCAFVCHACVCPPLCSHMCG